MQTRSELAEPAEVACQAIVDVFERLNAGNLAPADREALRRYLRADLATKSTRLHPDIQRAIWERAQAAQLPDSVRRRFSESGLGASPSAIPTIREAHRGVATGVSDKIKADVVLVTVIEEEFDAVLRSFGIEITSEATYHIRGGKFYLSHVARSSGPDLVVYITMIGEARNVPCVNACRDIFERFDVGACILIGVAGGNQSNVKLGDVVAATQVFDIEGGKSVLRFKFFERLLPRPNTYAPPTEIRRNIQNLDPIKRGWSVRLAASLNEYRNVELAKPIDSKAWDVRPAFHRAIIVVGEKVLANGSLPKTAKKLGDPVCAIEMEGSGFASACKHCDVPWLIIRGIADYGNPRKADGWQVVASVAAATLTRLFLETEYRRKDEELVL